MAQGYPRANPRPGCCRLLSVLGISIPLRVCIVPWIDQWYWQLRQHPYPQAISHALRKRRLGGNRTMKSVGPRLLPKECRIQHVALGPSAEQAMIESYVESVKTDLVQRSTHRHEEANFQNMSIAEAEAGIEALWPQEALEDVGGCSLGANVSQNCAKGIENSICGPAKIRCRRKRVGRLVHDDLQILTAAYKPMGGKRCMHYGNTSRKGTFGGITTDIHLGKSLNVCWAGGLQIRRLPPTAWHCPLGEEAKDDD
jgi:hypothetical protein